MGKRFIKVLLPKKVNKFFIYSIPDNFEIEKIKKGCRVIVPFGVSNYCSGIILDFSFENFDFKVKEIIEILDEEPFFDIDKQFLLINWFSKYYLCNIGEVLSMALPGLMKIESETFIKVSENFDGICQNLCDDQIKIISFLEKKKSINNLKKKINIKNFYKKIQSLYEKGVIKIYQNIEDKYPEKKISKIKIKENYINDKDEIILKFKKFPKRQSILIFYFDLVEKNNFKEYFFDKKLFEEHNFSKSSMNTLIKNGIFEEKKFVGNKFIFLNKKSEKLPKLSENQLKVYQKILKEFEKNQIVLFHENIADSKNEVLIYLIKKSLDQEKQVLYLVPEISTSIDQIYEILNFFGDKAIVYHSNFLDSSKKIEVWKKIIKKESKVIIGVKSSIFLPFKNLDLIIIDKENNQLYKNFNQNPKYNSKNCAIMLGKFHNAKVILTCSSPSFESFFFAKEKKYGFVNFLKNEESYSYPKIELIDMIKEKKNKNITLEFSNKILEDISNSLKEKEQILVFQNKKGYAVYISCDDCADVPYCINCDLSLVYHQDKNCLKCHICKFFVNFSSSCQKCNSLNIKNIGYGIEKIEKSLKKIFPGISVLTLDNEKINTKKKFEESIEFLKKNKVDVIISNKILSKEFFLKNLKKILIMQADNFFHCQDFRSTERAFQTIYELSRLFSKSSFNKILIQTFDTKNSIFKHLIEDSYENFFKKELEDRKRYNYPPFCKILKISLMDKDYTNAKKMSYLLYENISKKINFIKIYQPNIPIISKIKLFYIFEIIIKIPRLEEKNVYTNIKKELFEIIQDLKSMIDFKSCIVEIEIDL
jgi:primosomal protein N' (replication factor Y)